MGKDGKKKKNQSIVEAPENGISAGKVKKGMKKEMDGKKEKKESIVSTIETSSKGKKSRENEMGGKKDKKEVVNVQDSSTTMTTSGSGRNRGGKIISDARFSSVHSDPRFQRVSKRQSKISIDTRFSHMFSDKHFSNSSASVDKRGKRKNQAPENHPLRHYYQLDEEEEEPKNKDGSSSSDDEEIEDIKDGKLEKQDHKLDSESYSESEPDELEVDELDSDASLNNSDTDDEYEVYPEDEPVEEENVPVIEQETRRLAIVNMDWSHVRAVDLYVLLSSFLPKSGQILSVTVYPSEFGIKRMEEEAVHGPVGLFDKDGEKKEDDEDNDEDDEDDDDDEIDEEKLRAYEKSRLRYYYAVVECDSSSTADHLYKNCDGTEFERTSNIMDLRFIPDSVEFKHPPRDIATEVPSTYEALDFNTSALQHSKINLSWDEDEPQRAKTLKRNLNADQLAELEFNEFLASDDGESDDSEDNEGEDGNSDKKQDKKEKYRALLQAGDGASDEECGEYDKDMEVTFNTGLEDISKRILEKKKDRTSETVWEAHLRKRSEKRKARKNAKNSSEDESDDSDQDVPEQDDDFFLEEPSITRKSGKNDHNGEQSKDVEKDQEASKAELELLLAGDDEGNNNVKGYNMKHKKGKGKKGKKEAPSEDKLPAIDYEDPRFSAIFSSHLFALDPTDPQYKRSAAYARQLAQKRENGGRISNEEQLEPQKEVQPPQDETEVKKGEEETNAEGASSKKEKHELSSLVRSVKRKAQQVQLPATNKIARKDDAVKSVETKRGKKELSSMVQSIKKKIKH